MPIYEYACDTCDDILETYQRMTDEPRTECPSCQGKLTKLISSSTFHLKGEGWYAPSGHRTSSLKSPTH